MLLLRESIGAQRDLDLGDSPFKIRIGYDTSGRPNTQMRMYYPSGSALSVGQTMKVKYVIPTSGSPQVATPVSGTVGIDRIVVAVNATVSGTWDWFAIEGYCNALVNGTSDVAAGDALLMKIGTSANGMTIDGSTGSFVRTANTVGMALAASTANSDNLTAVFLIGENVILTQ